MRWSWKATAFAFLVSVSPALFQMMTDHRDLVTAAAASDGLTIAPAAVITAVCFYTSWRISPAASPTWLVAGTAVLGIQCVSNAALQVTNPETAFAQHAWMALADLVLLGAILALRAAQRTSPMRRYPSVIGAVVGLGIGLLRVTAVSRLPVIEPGLGERALVAVAGIVLGGGLAWLVMRADPVPLVVRERLVIALLLLTAGHAMASLDGSSRDAVNTWLGLACCVLGAVALIGAAIGMLRRTLLAESGLTTTLRTRLHAVEEDERRHRARIHEIESMMAGIVSASELVRHRQDVPAERRARLEEMIHEELGRLERLLRAEHVARQEARQVIQHSSQSWPSRADGDVRLAVPAAREDDPPGPFVTAPATVDLDRTIRHLVLAHEAKGTTVSWRPSGRRVAGHADDVAEVLNILLDNAARHGDASPSVSVHEAPQAVEILVSDHGPGIAPEIRDQLFQWGARGPGSPGQGIGLHIAQDLMEKAGGYLRLSEAGAGEGGATFVMGLPRTVDEPIGGPEVRTEVDDGILA